MGEKDGEYVDRDEAIAELETEKATFEVNAEQAGSLKIIAKEGDTLNIGSVLAHIDETAAKPAAAAAAAPAREQPVPCSGNKTGIVRGTCHCRYKMILKLRL